MNIYKVESAGWYMNAMLPNNTELPDRYQAGEAATLAVNRFFEGAVRLSNIKKPLTIAPLIRVTKNGAEYLFYSPRIIANAGWHNEAILLHEKINLHNYEMTV